MFGRVGSMLAPIVGRELGKTNPQATITIFAFLSMIAGVFTLWLPETRGLKMIDTIEEAEALGKHSSEIRGLRSMKCSSKMHQNLLHFMYKKTHVVFFVFHFVQLYSFPYECPGLC